MNDTERENLKKRLEAIIKSLTKREKAELRAMLFLEMLVVGNDKTKAAFINEVSTLSKEYSRKSKS